MVAMLQEQAWLGEGRANMPESQSNENRKRFRMHERARESAP